MKTLTICIPTYNRVELLKSSIDSILNAIKFANCNVDIIISDNCSHDNTESFCLELTNNYSFIHYYKNKENVVDLNFYLAVQKSNTDFVWIFGDDDILNLNAIKIVTDAIISNHNLIVLNYDLYNNDLSHIKKSNYLNINNNLFYNNKNRLLMDFNLKLGFISCVIFERKAFLEIPLEVFDEYRPYGFPFVYSLYSTLNDNLNAIFISEPILLQRGDDLPREINWWYKCFVEGSSIIFDKLQNHGYSNKAITIAKKSVFINYVFSDLLWRKINSLTTKVATIYIYRYYKKFPFHFFIAIFIIATPNYIIKKIYNFKQKYF